MDPPHIVKGVVVEVVQFIHPVPGRFHVFDRLVLLRGVEIAVGDLVVERRVVGVEFLRLEVLVKGLFKNMRRFCVRAYTVVGLFAVFVPLVDPILGFFHRIDVLEVAALELDVLLFLCTERCGHHENDAAKQEHAAHDPARVGPWS